MIEKRKHIDIGSRVKLNDDVHMTDIIYKKGHEFTVYRGSDRGWDLVDDEGNKLDETRFISNKLELI